MKKKFFKATTVVLATCLFAACSNDSVVGNESVTDSFNANGEGYMALNISIPSAKGTRANTDFKDPVDTPQEYQVENITLVLFSGENENDAQLRSAYSINDQTDQFGADNQEQTTSIATVVTAINRTGIETTDNIYAFVILNDHGFYHVAKSASSNTTTLYDGNGIELTGTSFAEFRQLELNETGRDYSHQSFFMSNAPVLSVGGGNKAVDAEADTHTLVQIDRDKIHGNKEQAAADVASIINVERALAKITVNFDTNNLGSANGTIQNGELEYELTNWIIDNTNPLTYVTRNFRKADYDALESSWPINYVNEKSTLVNSKYRFASKNWIDAAEAPDYSYRTFWAVDANYEDAGNSDHKLITVSDKTFGEISEPLRENNATYYCTENTFNVQNQSEKNTTRLVVAAKFNGGADFYTMEENATTFYKAGNGAGSIRAKVYEILANRVDLGLWMNKFRNPDWEDPLTLADFIRVNFECNSEVAGTDIVTVTFNDPADDAMFIDKDAAKDEFLKNGANSLMSLTNDYLAREFKFYHYKQGLAYYTSPIRHFGAGSDGYGCEAPWVSTEHEGVENSTAGVYVGKNAVDVAGATYMDEWATAEQNYLGRYGIVRNSWYDITIAGIRAIGSPVIPDITDSNAPDDQVKNSMAVKINITPWVSYDSKVIL